MLCCIVVLANHCKCLSKYFKNSISNSIFSVKRVHKDFSDRFDFIPTFFHIKLPV